MNVVIDTNVLLQVAFTQKPQKVDVVGLEEFIRILEA